MYQLKKLKLINWHFLVNVDINIEGNVLVTGENGTGKSTLLDAIQFVLTGGKSKFNSAAHDQSQRNLLGYVRCKTGDESNQYVRNGDITAHIALEFLETNTNVSFILGTVIDSPKSLVSPDSIFYLIENYKITDDLFLIDKIPLDISGFKKNLNRINPRYQIETKQTATQEMIRNRLGNLEPRFFSMLTKSLTFKAMKDVNDFVFNFLLDKKELEVESLKENIAKYQEFEQILTATKEQLAKLENIKEKYLTILDYNRNIDIDNVLLKLLGKLAGEEKIESTSVRKKEIEAAINRLSKEQTKVELEIEQLRIEERELRLSLEQNRDYSTIASIKNGINSANESLSHLEEKMSAFRICVNRESEIAKVMIKESGAPEISKMLNALGDIDNEENQKTVEALAYKIYDLYQEKIEEISENKLLIDQKKKELGELISSSQRRIDHLGNNKIYYPSDVENLRDTLKEGLSRLYKTSVEPKILCELLEVTDDKWRNAIEGALGMGKFNIIVEPRYFDAAIRIYEEEKRIKRIYNVGLVNTNKFLYPSTVMDGSLAEYLTSPISYVKNYVDSMLGTMICCEDVNQLKNYNRSITPSVMIYQNHTARSIDPKNFARHYIGRSAYQSQMSDESSIIDSSKKEYQILLNKSMALDEKLNLLKESDIENLLENLSLSQEIDNIKRKIREYKIRLNEEESDKFSSKEEKISTLINNIRHLDINKKAVEEKIIDEKAQLKSLDYQNMEVVNQIETLKKEIETCKVADLANVIKAEEKLAKLKSKSYEEYWHDCQRRINNQKSRSEEMIDELKALQLDYNNQYHFGASLGLESMKEYNQVHMDIKIDKLLAYEEKATKARESAENQFKEQWLSKIRDNILEARRDLGKINSALRGVKFGRDEYEFKFSVNPLNQEIYALIMDPDVVDEKVSFESLGNKHPYAMDKIRELMFSQVERENNELLDYRNYMIYDILIKGEDSIISFAKVCREKSGGETQTPYYVTIIASFIQIYKNVYPDSIGIILFDEVFDKMDDVRISSMMQFILRLDLQVIMASPPQRMEDIARYTETTLVLIKEKKTVVVEEIFNKKIERESELISVGE